MSAAQGAGFEVRDLENLREHYALTLRRWVANLEAHSDEAIALVGEGRFRVWRLYMAESARNFERGRIQVHQVLAVAATEALPACRSAGSTPSFPRAGLASDELRPAPFGHRIALDRVPGAPSGPAWASAAQVRCHQARCA